MTAAKDNNELECLKAALFYWLLPVGTVKFDCTNFSILLTTTVELVKCPKHYIPCQNFSIKCAVAKYSRFHKNIE